MITPSRHTVSERLIKVLKQCHPEFDGDVLADLRNSLMTADFIDIGSLEFETDVDILKGYECFISLNHVAISWVWSEQTASSPSSCQRLVVKCSNVSVLFRNRRDIDTVASSNENIPCNNKVSNEDFLFSWLLKCTPESEFMIDQINLDFDPDSSIDLNTAQYIFFEYMSRGILSLHFTNKCVLTNKIKPMIKIKKIILNWIGMDGFILSYIFVGCFTEFTSSTWTIEEAVLHYPFLLYRLSMKAIKLEVEFSSTDIIAAIIEKVVALHLDSKFMRLSLRQHEIPNVHLVFNKNEGLKVLLNSSLSLRYSSVDGCSSQYSYTSLCVPIYFKAPELTVDMQMENNAIFMSNFSFELTGVVLGTNAVLQADSARFGKYIKISALQISGAIDSTVTAIDAFQLKISRLLIQPNDDGMKWLHEISDSIQQQHWMNARASLGKISQIEVHFQKNVMNMFDFSKFQIEDTMGDMESTLKELILSIIQKLTKEINRRRNAQKVTRQEMADSAAITAGSAILATSIATPIGAAVSIAALGVRDQVGKAVIAGKQERGVSEHEAYRFGDISRGIASKFRKKTSQDQTPEKESILQDKRRLAGVGGMSAGAIVGSILLGPVGAAAGAMIGSRVAKARSNDEDNSKNRDPEEE